MRKIIVEAEVSLDGIMGGDNMEFWKQIFSFHSVGELTRTLLRHGLVDELCILVFPFVFGEGLRIFEHVAPQTLELLTTKTFDSGVVALQYRPRSATG